MAAWVRIGLSPHFAAKQMIAELEDFELARFGKELETVTS